MHNIKSFEIQLCLQCVTLIEQSDNGSNPLTALIMSIHNVTKIQFLEVFKMHYGGIKSVLY